MSYLELLNKVNVEKINVSKAMVAQEVEYYFDYFCISDLYDEEELKDKYEYYCHIVHEAYLKSDGLHIENLSSKLCEMIYIDNIDEKTITPKMLIENTIE